MKYTVLTIRHLARLSFLAMLLLALPASAQQEQRRITVKSFRADRLATTARSDAYKRTDSDGRLYAIVKVRSNAGDDLTAYTFDFGNMTHVVGGVHDDGALWLYVKRNAEYMTIRRQGYTTVSRYKMGDGLEEGVTYELKISAQAPAVKKRSLLFEVKPANVRATIKVKREGTDGDYELLGVVDHNGRRSDFIETGEWLYEVTADGYLPSTGRVTLTEGNGPERERVQLREAWGTMQVDNPEGVSEAEIYVDDIFIGTTPYNDTRKWSIGEHRVVVKKGELYSDYVAQVLIESGKTAYVKPELKATFAQVTVAVEADADIFIDGQLRGRREWSGPLNAGLYTVEARMDRHRTTTRQIEVGQGASQTFAIEPPQPITGRLLVNTDPVGAIVSIDGNRMGETPLDRQLLIGQYALTVTMDGYQTENRTVDIDDGAEENLDISMREIVTKKMIRKREKARKDSLKAAEKAEKDSLKAAGQGLGESKKERRSSGDTSAFGGFVQAGMSAGSLMGAELGAGLRIGSVTLEASYTMGLGKSDAVYWNYDTDTDPVETVYKPTAFAIRLGYAIGKGSLRFTPQIGARMTAVSSEDGASKCNATSATLGLRLDYRLAKAVSIFAAPEMGFAVSKSTIFTQLADVDSTIKGWGSGFNARIGLSINF